MGSKSYQIATFGTMSSTSSRTLRSGPAAPDSPDSPDRGVTCPHNLQARFLRLGRGPVSRPQIAYGSKLPAGKHQGQVATHPGDDAPGLEQVLQRSMVPVCRGSEALATAAKSDL